MDQEGKDYVDRALKHERELTDEKFRSRDMAITLLATDKRSYVAIALSILVPLILRFLVR
jgi:hypothetical protein